MRPAAGKSSSSSPKPTAAGVEENNRRVGEGTHLWSSGHFVGDSAGPKTAAGGRDKGSQPKEPPPKMHYCQSSGGGRGGGRGNQAGEKG
jgi:hypothetical protein